MLKGDENKNYSNSFDKIYTKWLIVLAILGFAVYFIIPFPLSLLVSSVIILLMMVSLNVHIMKKLKLDEKDSNNNSNKNDSGRRIRGMFNSLSLSLIDDPRVIFGYNPLKFYCMCCGKEHKKRKCPSCGSMAVRVE